MVTAPVKKPRTPKPPINHGTHTLLKFIPFLNCDPLKTEEMLEHIVPQMDVWTNNQGKLVRKWEHDKDVIDGIRETRSDIRILFTDTKNPAILERINGFLKGLAPSVRGGSGEMSLLVSLRPPKSAGEGSPGYDRDFNGIWIPGFRAMIYAIAVEAFTPADFATIKESNVSFYIGQCPKCAKIFEKTRGDQEYCGKACKAASLQKKYYDEKK